MKDRDQKLIFEAYLKEAEYPTRPGGKPWAGGGPQGQLTLPWDTGARELTEEEEEAINIFFTPDNWTPGGTPHISGPKTRKGLKQIRNLKLELTDQLWDLFQDLETSYRNLYSRGIRAAFQIKINEGGGARVGRPSNVPTGMIKSFIGFLIHHTNVIENNIDNIDWSYFDTDPGEVRQHRVNSTLTDEELEDLNTAKQIIPAFQGQSATTIVLSILYIVALHTRDGYERYLRTTVDVLERRAQEGTRDDENM
tara:strand:- start:2498 stop:3253 length:756 start_codon:yes stop_codon:yes gene_type:complete